MGGGHGDSKRNPFKDTKSEKNTGRKVFVSKKKQKHIENRHNPNNYAKQINNKPKAEIIKELQNKTFFNKSWTSSQIKQAVTEGFKQALKNGVTSGKYTLLYNGEKIAVILEGGLLKTAYGFYQYTYEQLLELLG